MQSLTRPAVRIPRALVAAATVGIAACLLACGNASETPSAPDAPAKTETPTETQPAKSPKKRNERPLPTFSGVDLNGKRVGVSDLLGKRLVILIFNPEAKPAAATASAFVNISKQRGKHNFELLGIGTGSNRGEVSRFAENQRMDFPVIDDSSARIANLLGARSPVLVLMVDADGYVMGGFPVGKDAPDDVGVYVEKQLREQLRLPQVTGSTTPSLGEHPLAPEVVGTDFEGKAFRLSAERGAPVILIFFLHTCPHCHHALGFLKEQLAKIPEAKRPKVVGISLRTDSYAVKERLKSMDLDFLPIITDPGQKLQEAWGIAGVPDLIFVDAEGRIVARGNGWEDQRDPPLWRMRLAKLAGVPVPMLLHSTGYSGNEFCGVCHENELVTWELTNHAYAFDTLVKHTAERDEECVSCHVVGFEKPGGYSMDTPSFHLEDVGCESCHGRGGPHLSPDFVPKGTSYETACVTCHDTKHSLGFEYAGFLPRVSHAANANLLELSLDEKLAFLETRGKKQALLPTEADYVGSDSCQECHAKEYETWSAGAHARAGETLAKENQERNADCLKCHTTGFGQTGGFPKGSRATAHADLGRVGCESCHGPGGDHVGADAPKIGTIVSLTDKCGSCVILQICGSCHDDANDPGFEFEVDDKIEKQRHGTIEPSAGVPPKEALLHAPDSALVGTLEHAFRSAPSGG